VNARRSRPSAIEPALLTFAEACIYLRCGESYLKQHKAEIGYVGGGKFLRFERAALDAWIARRRVLPKGETPELARRSRRPIPLRRASGVNPLDGEPWDWETSR
jgi:hypothetical protein